MVVIFIIVIIGVFIHYYRKTDDYERSKYYRKFIGKKSAWYPNMVLDQHGKLQDVLDKLIIMKLQVGI